MGADPADAWRLGTKPAPDSPMHLHAQGAPSPLDLALTAAHSGSLGLTASHSSEGGGALGGKRAADTAQQERERAAQLEASLADVRARITALEEDVLALEFAASAPEEVAELQVAFQNPHLQVRECTAGCGLHV